MHSSDSLDTPDRAHELLSGEGQLSAQGHGRTLPECTDAAVDADVDDGVGVGCWIGTPEKRQRFSWRK